ncbi:MAG: adenine-specific DNA-methyltransferase, partial [Mycobacteriales bacterium]
HDVREWLLTHVQSLNVDLFPPASFPRVLQEVVILSGRMVEAGHRASRNLHLREHRAGDPREWAHEGLGGFRTWTRFLLSPRQVASLSEATDLASVTPLGQVARFEVATVTGANTFFCVDDTTARQYALQDWTRPLLPRTRHAPGLAYTHADHAAVVAGGARAHLLDFAADRPDPRRRAAPLAYLAAGAQAKLPDRYKCRIRTPWYRVPVVAPGAVLMAKRSHHFPRALVNEAGVTTTDTIYRGRLLPEAGMTRHAVAASFHNSLTLLTAEIEGRSFGGGVLELVPSEISRLALPHPDRIGDEFDRLDRICRRADGDGSESLVEETDVVVATRTPGLTRALLAELHEALTVLRELRHARG